VKQLQVVMVCLAALAAVIGALAPASGVVAADTQPPTAPTNLRVTGTTDTSVSVAWDPSTDEGGGVHYRISQDDGYLTWDWYSGPGGTFTGLDQGSTHTFAVRAVDAAGNVSAPSNTITVTLQPGDVTPPTAPTGLRVTGVTSSTVSLAWQPASDASGISYYRIYRNGEFLLGWNDTTTFTDRTGLAPGTTYRYSVAAVDGAPRPNEGPQSDTVIATTAG
jgi:chitodextrinase